MSAAFGAVAGCAGEGVGWWGGLLEVRGECGKGLQAVRLDQEAGQGRWRAGVGDAELAEAVGDGDGERELALRVDGLADLGQAGGVGGVDAELRDGVGAGVESIKILVKLAEIVIAHLWRLTFPLTTTDVELERPSRSVNSFVDPGCSRLPPFPPVGYVAPSERDPSAFIFMA